MTRHRISRYGARLLPLAFAALLIESAGARFIEHKERHLGPTGLYGVTSPTGIRITKVAEGSPADGRIKVGEVIVAAGGAALKDQTRKQLAAAIDQAETAEAKGILSLSLEDGRKVDLKLEILGSYSETAPNNCPKTDAIITRAADHLAMTRKFGRADMNIGMLGMLATGETKYIDVVREEIHAAEWAKPDIKLSLETYNRTAWSWGYTNLLLGEYFMLTRDEYVMPALTAYSIAIAGGRDAAGLWGHGMATLDLNRGQPNGRLPGYAVMNQSSLPCFLSLLIARKAGIRHPEIDACIAQTHGFYTDFIGRGTLPYGVHDPSAKSFNNNGMSGLAAVAFAVHGNKEGAAFFSKMSAAATGTMESGHTGHFFNQMWTGPGANVAGPEISAAFFKETRWLHTLNRSWDGSFTYDCSEYPDPIFSYRGLSDTGSHLLNHCLGRRKLLITGRDADPSLWLKGRDTQAAIALATLDVNTLDDDGLLGLFGHALPKIRNEAVWALRPRQHPHLDKIRGMLREGTREQRLSAIEYFGYECPPEQAQAALPALTAVLRDPAENPEIRAAAAGSLALLGEAAYPTYGDMLKVLAKDKPDDPRGRIDERVGAALAAICPDPYKAGLIKDKELFYQAVRKLLDHRRAIGRTYGVRLITHMPIGDFHRVGDRLRHIIDDQDLTYHAYHNLGPQTESLMVFANLGIEGGVEATFRILDSPLGKMGFKLRLLMAVLPKYGAAAQPHLPRLREMAPGGRFDKPWKEMIEAIGRAEGPAKAIRFEDAMKAGVPAK
jgi:hypothetical protein